MLKENQYLVILPFMVDELCLKGNELLVYACVHGFSQTDSQEYTGGIRYLQAWTGATKQTVISSLNSLCEKGYVEKTESFLNGVRLTSYRSKNLTTGQEIMQNGSKNLTGVVKNFEQTGQKIRPNNKRNINNNINNNNIGGRFSPPSIQDVAEYCRLRANGINPERFIDYYQQQGWKLSNGNPMKDWRAAVRTWESRNPKGQRGVNHELDEVF